MPKQWTAEQERQYEHQAGKRSRRPNGQQKSRSGRSDKNCQPQLREGQITPTARRTAFRNQGTQRPYTRSAVQRSSATKHRGPLENEQNPAGECLAQVIAEIAVRAHRHLIRSP